MAENKDLIEGLPTETPELGDVSLIAPEADLGELEYPAMLGINKEAIRVGTISNLIKSSVDNLNGAPESFWIVA